MRQIDVDKKSYEQKMTFVKAKTGPANIRESESKFTVHYFDKNGNMTIRSGGIRTWICNNPGSIHRSHSKMRKKEESLSLLVITKMNMPSR